MQRFIKLFDDTVKRITGGVQAGACVPNAFTCCFTPGLEHICTGNCRASSYC